MKKIVLGALLSCAGWLGAQAQVEKGDWLVGGSININTSSNTTVSITPSAGYFFLNRFAAGGIFNVSYEKTSDLKSTIIGIGPFARYYFGKGNLKPFLASELLFGSTKYQYPGENSFTRNGHNFFLGGGLAAFVNEHVAIETQAGYTNTKYSGNPSDNGLAIRIGFQIYLAPRGIVDTYRKQR